MDQYAEIIGEDASSDDYYKIASHFDNAGDHYKAGKFYFASKYYDKVTKIANGHRITVDFVFRHYSTFFSALFCMKEMALIWPLKLLLKQNKRS